MTAASRTFFRAALDSPIQPLAVAFDEAGALRALSFHGEKGDALKSVMAREYPGCVLTEALIISTDAPSTLPEVLIIDTTEGA